VQALTRPHELYFPVSDEINGGHHDPRQQNINALIGKRDVLRARRANHAGNNSARAGLVRRTYAHPSDEAHFEGKLFHGRNLGSSLVLGRSGACGGPLVRYFAP
jgi:hypothetical protein